LRFGKELDLDIVGIMFAFGQGQNFSSDFLLCLFCSVYCTCVSATVSTGANTIDRFKKSRKMYDPTDHRASPIYSIATEYGLILDQQRLNTMKGTGLCLWV
jgi:hypothetical protein